MNQLKDIIERISEQAEVARSIEIALCVLDVDESRIRQQPCRFGVGRFGVEMARNLDIDQRSRLADNLERFPTLAATADKGLFGESEKSERRGAIDHFIGGVAIARNLSQPINAGQLAMLASNPPRSEAAWRVNNFMGNVRSAFKSGASSETQPWVSLSDAVTKAADAIRYLDDAQAVSDAHDAVRTVYENMGALIGHAAAGTISDVVEKSTGPDPIGRLHDNVAHVEKQFGPALLETISINTRWQDDDIDRRRKTHTGIEQASKQANAVVSEIEEVVEVEAAQARRLRMAFGHPGDRLGRTCSEGQMMGSWF